MKKVLFVATVTPHINAFHIPYLKWFKEQGYEVHVASYGDEEIAYCDKHYNLPFARKPLKVQNYKVYRELKTIIEENQYEIVHCHTPVGGVLARLASRKERKNGTKVIYTAHGFHFFKGAPLINWLIYYPIEKIMSRYTDTIITINQEDYELAKKKFKKSKTIELVHGVGLDLSRFDINIKQEELDNLRQEFGIADEDIVLGYVAELNKNKNQILIIKAIEQLVKQNKNYKLILIGDGVNKEELELYVKENKLENNIKLIGRRNDVPKLLKIIDIYVASSLREGLPVNILEALYMGLPVVALDNRGHREAAKYTENIKICSENDENLLATIIKDIEVSCKSDRQDKSREDIKNFMLDNVLKEMKRIYTGVFFMNNLLYIHTAEKVKCDSKQKYYTDGSYSENVWDRYINFAEKSVTFYTSKDDKTYEDDFIKKKYNKIPDNIKVVTIENLTKSIRTFLSLRLRNQHKKRLEKLVMETDAVIIRVPCSASKAAIRFAKKYNKPYMLEIVGCPWDALWNYNLKGKVLAPAAYLNMKKIVKQAKYSVYVTNEFLQKRYPTKGKSTNCSNVVLETLNEKDFLERKIKDKDEKIVLGTSAAIDVRYKGQENVIKILPNLIKKGYNIEYQLIGNGDKTRLENIAKKYNVEDRVKLIGSIPHNEVFDWLNSVDIYIQPSKQEGLPRALIEAMSKACPAIGTNVAGIPELLEKECIYKKNDLKGLEKCISKLIEDKDFTKKQSELNFEKSKEYSVNTINERRLKFYQEFKKQNKML